MTSYIDKIKELCPKLDEIGIGAIDKYISNQSLNKDEDRILNNINIQNIQVQGKKIPQIDIDNIDTYVSFFSLAVVGKYEYSLLEKNLKIFNKIENIYFIATPQSLQDCEKEKNRLEEKDENINITIIEIESNNYDNIYHQLLVELEFFDKSKILIDNTLGPRIIGYNLYKFSIDQGTKLITWQSSQIKGFANRVPGTDTLNYIEFPQLKNSSVINNINKLIEEYKFIEASNLAKSINNMEEAIIYKELGKIFSIDVIFKFSTFYPKIKNFYDTYFLKNINSNLKEKLDELKKDFKFYFEHDELSKKIAYLVIMVDFYKKNLKHAEILKDIVLDMIFITMNLDKKEDKEKIKNFILNKNSESIELSNILMDLCCIKDGKNKLVALDEENLVYKHLKYKLPKTLSLENNILYFKKYDIKIDLNEESKKSSGAKKLKNLNCESTGVKKLLKPLFESFNNEICDKDFREYFGIETKTKGAINTRVSRFKEDILEINNFIFNFIKENYPTKAIYFENNEFIIFEKIIKELKTRKVPKDEAEKLLEQICIKDKEKLRRKRNFKTVVDVEDEYIFKINSQHF